MKVSIISDTHFGYKWGEERGEDAFENAKEAFENSLDADLIILPGDIFDRKIPKQEVLDRAAEVLSVAMEGESDAEPDKELGMHGNGIPVVAIHGTHERRPRSYTNPIELMDRTGQLYHLDNEKVIFEKDGEKVAVHGMSGVPERYAPKVLEKFDPEPVEDAFNILVVHQSIEGFVYTSDDHDVLSLEDFPEGFDLIIDGHIHWYNLDRFNDPDREDEKPLVLPGSTVTTQMRKVEAEKDKGFLMLDTETEELDFRPLESPREVHYIELEVEGEPWTEVKEHAINELKQVGGEKPLVNLKIDGETEGRVNPRELKQMFRDEMFLNVNSSVDRTEISSESSLESEKDPWTQGKEMLREQVEADDLDLDEFLQLLESGEVEGSIEKLKNTEFEERQHDNEDTG
ncbi:MAG: exonuclease SbcCD subunit D [Candidatus Nanohaloarchaea archaeon]